MISYAFLALASFMIITAAILIITIATRRFLKGEFKDILKWLLFGFWFMALPYSLFIIREAQSSLSGAEEFVGWVIYFFMIAVGLCILRAAMLLDRFSRNYGFANIEKRGKK